MHLELKIRHGKGGHPYSPETTSGYVGWAVFIWLVCGAMAAAAATTELGWRLLFILAILGSRVFIVTRDLVAWLLATEAERDAFRHRLKADRFEVEMKRLERASAPARDLGWGAWGLATLMFGAAALVIFLEAKHLRPLILIPALGWLYVTLRVGFEARTKLGPSSRQR